MLLPRFAAKCFAASKKEPDLNSIESPPRNIGLTYSDDFQRSGFCSQAG
jgi:hypothetical protein